MKRIAALLALVTLAAAGGAWASQREKDARPFGPLPSRGLLVTHGQNTLLIGLDGRVRARLAGLRPAWFAKGDTARNAAFQQLAAIMPDRPLLVDSRGRWYGFDSLGRLDALATPRLRISGDIEVVAHTVATSDGVFQVAVTVERAGREIVPAAAGLRHISGSLAVGSSTAVDLQTGDHWRVPSNCYAAASRNSELLMFCGPGGGKSSVSLLAVSTKGLRRTLANLPNSLYPTAAYVSPNGKYLVGMFSPGCGPSYGFVVSTNGGVARPLTGERRWSSSGPNSIALGWTEDNRVVALVEPSGTYDRKPTRGAYLIDPATLTRSLVFPGADAWAMWSPAGS